tara:strand:+ start:38 stop:226 length:189 start_codon:yes stop_codon:yes gene_type:complete
MAIRIDIKTDNKSEAKGAFQLVSFLNQLDVGGEVHGIWADKEPMSITIDWSGRVETIKDHVE